MRTVILTLLAMLVAGCAVAGGQQGSDPPAASVDGVAGKAVSYCWETRCVDGFPTPDAPLLQVSGALRWAQAPAEVQVFVRRGDGPGFEQQAVAVSNGRLGALPSGDWDYLLVMARYLSRSAMYAWRLR